MKILIIGGTGTIGHQVAAHFAQSHQVLIAGRSSQELPVDIADSASIRALYAKTGKLDAVLCIAGEAKWAPFESLSEDDYYIGIRNKLMGQVNLVRLGLEQVNPGGSFTLTTGILADDPVLQTSSAAMVNGALHSFAQAVALELKQDRRINVVSSGLVEDAVDKYQAYFPGHDPVPMSRVLKAYIRSVEGAHTGQIIRVY